MNNRGPSRRAVLASTMSLVTGAVVMQANADPGAYLAPTRYLDHQAAPIPRLVRELTATQSTETSKALAIFEFVRDQIPFGFATGFWNQTATQVLRAGRGYCNTKSTLFVALLRAAGVPARQVFVDIDAAVLHGVISPGTPFVDHSYVEVLLDGGWRATDAYIVDATLFPHAQARVRAEGRLLGYGVHTTGASQWTGRDPTFSQYNINDARPLGTRVWGVYADVGDFYDRANGAWNRLNALTRAGFGALASGANTRLDAMRAH